MRAQLPVGMLTAGGGPPAEWAVAGEPVPYAAALAHMDARVAA